MSSILFEIKNSLVIIILNRPGKRFAIPKDGVECPLSFSANTRLVSEFGRTACKALYPCNDCKESFDYFKCH